MVTQHTYAKMHNVGGPGPFTKIMFASALIAGSATATANVAPLFGAAQINESSATAGVLAGQARLEALTQVLSRYGRPVAIDFSADPFGTASNVVTFTFEGTQEGILGGPVNLVSGMTKTSFGGMSIPAKPPVNYVSSTAGATGNITVGATMLAAGFPQSGTFNVLLAGALGYEICLATASSTTTLTVTGQRGKLGTTGLAHPVGTAVYMSPLAAVTEGQAQNMTAAIGKPPFYYVSKTLPGVGASMQDTGSLLAEAITINYDPAAAATSKLFSTLPFLYNGDTTASTTVIAMDGTNVNNIVAAFVP